MTSKARFEAERQKQRILLESVFGIWTDARKTIRVRIAPVRNSVRIRIVEILDKTIIDSIVYFCGLNATPKTVQLGQFRSCNGPDEALGFKLLWLWRRTFTARYPQNKGITGHIE